MLQINFTKQAEKFLRKIPSKHAKQIAKKIMSIRENPLPNDSKKLIDTAYLRTDVGEYRIIYLVEENILNILLIGKRNDGEVYRKLKRSL
jgi:mRNA interferase RelE/StbE